MIALRGEEHLCLVFQAAERLGVDDAIAIALKCGADAVFSLRSHSALAVGALGRNRRQNLPFSPLEFLSNRHHEIIAQIELDYAEEDVRRLRRLRRVRISED